MGFGRLGQILFYNKHKEKKIVKERIYTYNWFFNVFMAVHNLILWKIIQILKEILVFFFSVGSVEQSV